MAVVVVDFAKRFADLRFRQGLHDGGVAVPYHNHLLVQYYYYYGTVCYSPRGNCFRFLWPNANVFPLVYICRYAQTLGVLLHPPEAPRFHFASWQTPPRPRHPQSLQLDRIIMVSTTEKQRLLFSVIFRKPRPQPAGRPATPAQSASVCRIFYANGCSTALSRGH